MPKEVFCIFPCSLLISRKARNALHATSLPTPPQYPNTYSEDRFSPETNQAVSVHHWAQGRHKPGSGEKTVEGGGAHGQHPGANPGCAFTSDPKPRGLQMSTRVSVLGRFVCGAQEKWSKDHLLWLRFECTVISHPGEGIPYLVTHFRKSSLLACDNNQGRERKFPGVCTLSPSTA